MRWVSGPWAKPQFFIIAAVCLSACAQEEELPTSGLSDEDPYRVTQNFEARETEGGNLVWLLKAKEARTYERPARTLMDSLQVFFYHQDGSLRSTLWSDIGRAQEEKGVLIAQGNVILISTTGDTLETDFLRFKEKEDEISGPGPVRLAQEGRVLTGEGFRSKPDLTDYEVFKNVKIISREFPEEFKDNGEQPEGDGQ